MWRRSKIFLIFAPRCSLQTLVDLCGTKIFCHSRLVPRFQQVQCACERHVNVRILFLLGNLALVCVVDQGFLVLAVIRSICGTAYRANCHLVFRWVPSEFSYSDRESRFYDAAYDPPRVCPVVCEQQSVSSLAAHPASSSSLVSTSPCHHMNASLANPVESVLQQSHQSLLCHKPAC